MINDETLESIKPHQLVVSTDGAPAKIGVVLEVGEDGCCQVWWAWTKDWSFSVEDTANLARF